MAARFLALVESWAAPSAVLCAYRDPAAPDGVRMVPELTSGAVSGTPERALAKLFAEHPPDSLTRPTLLGPAEGPTGFKVRDTLVIPWSHGSSVLGFLVLRGLPRPQPSNLGDAVVLLSQAMWSRVVPPASTAPSAGPAAGQSAEDRLRDLGRLAERLVADWQEAKTASEGERKKVEAQLAMLQGEVEAGKTAVAAAEEGRAAGEAAAKAREQAEAERDAARAEAAEAKGRGESLQRDLDATRAEGTELKARVGTLERGVDAARAEVGSSRASAEAASGKAKEQAESERDAARSEAAELKTRVETLQRDLDAARAQGESSRASAEAASGKAKEQAESERDGARAEAAELKARIETLQRDLDAARAQGESSRASAEAASGKAKEQAESERDAARTEAAELKTRVETLQRDLDAAHAQAESSRTSAAEASGKAKEQAESERDGARAEAAELKGRVETLQHDLDLARSQAEGAGARADAAGRAREQTEAERDAARSEATELRTRAEGLQRDLEAARSQPAPVAESGAERERWTKSEAVFRSAVEAIRRTPFLPPTVRVWVGEAESLLDAKPARDAQLGRILLLDRDAPMLSTLAGELEQAGLDVLIAHHPDEVALFLKTPDAQGLTALVLDVLALRPDQNLAELVRAWRHDQPGLAVFLTFRADNSTESERAQRLPSTATAGYLPRPLQKKALLDAVATLSRRPKR